VSPERRSRGNNVCMQIWDVFGAVYTSEGSDLEPGGKIFDRV
jgi:hypothetical protein